MILESGQSLKRALHSYMRECRRLTGLWRRAQPDYFIGSLGTQSIILLSCWDLGDQIVSNSSHESLSGYLGMVYAQCLLELQDQVFRVSLTVPRSASCL